MESCVGQSMIFPEVQGNPGNHVTVAAISFMKIKKTSKEVKSGEYGVCIDQKLLHRNAVCASSTVVTTVLTFLVYLLPQML